ncbi:alpha-N-acetylgalactosaminide alpha-2,6-sialyltransferase 1 [Meriones unguiculatus]|uniref:alpha-N-acetylgalactosaminide alpha-2,6-sialyltransferase 1 n=1 Tax=Meriones unguiculatus TaxID=10047 RepID=UPI00293F52F1|nr:alpha-N-acetylgalactosaminide alpha-2,6-sialyltransferase 1 [Meriones unguiculatus]
MKRLALTIHAFRDQPVTMKTCCGPLHPRCQIVLFLTVLTMLFLLSSFIKEPSTKPSRYQSIKINEKRSQEMVPKAAHHQPIMALLPGIQEKGTTSVRREGLGLQSQDREAARSGEAKRETMRTASREHQSKSEPTAKMLAPERSSKRATVTGALPTGLRKRPPATGAVPAREKVAQAPPSRASLPATGAVPAREKAAQAPPSRASFPHPTTKRSQRLKASDFKSEPRWDFEEEYSSDGGDLQTTCPDSLKVRASKSPWLQNIFLPNITLFLDSEHFSQSEWDRLEHFGPPFGFMELNQSLVQKVVSRFPRVPHQQLLLASLDPGKPRCITCAVVGNGGILNDSRVGQDIDSHDYVFRLSGAVTKGYERDVGTRTSFYGFTAFSLVQSILTLGRQGFQHVPLGKDVRYLHFLEGTRDYEWLEAMFLNQTMAKTKLSWFRHRPQEAFRDALDLNRYLLLHPDFLRYMKNRFLRSKALDTVHWRIYRPTTGALLLLTALHLCDKVSAYGFITQGHERFSDHYYDKTWKKLIFYINHDFKLERTVWKQLHDEGIIWLYQRPQSTKAES